MPRAAAQRVASSMRPVQAYLVRSCSCFTSSSSLLCAARSFRFASRRYVPAGVEVCAQAAARVREQDARVRRACSRGALARDA